MAKPDNYEAFAKMHEVFRLGIFFESFGGTDCNLHTVQRFIGLDCAMKKLEQSQQDRNSRERDGAAPNLC